ncbi:MAG: NTP transferase domain-containing protein [Deltaproteobacteria bacterium]|nr:NTP transferase domain-containing protein [Deltaproteobacteria bacterium]MCB9487543.1 NTP transferase domain-containing protein [Deltaproteobacteria bacterium]
MRAVILAGGTATRMRPLTDITNKHLLPVGRVPMIYHPIAQFKRAGLRDILVVTGREHMGHMVQQLGSGHQFGVNFTFKVQDRAGGIAEALGLAKDFAGSEAVAVHLGDNIFGDSIAPYVKAYRDGGEQGAMIFLKAVDDPQRFGVAHIDEAGKVLSIVEKPSDPQSNLAVTGLYFYDNSVFDVVPRLEPSARGELEITDVNNHFINAGTLRSFTLDGFWTDAGTMESWKRANELSWEMDFADLIEHER